jgi:LytS/YehU family sensor histidine kinase
MNGKGVAMEQHLETNTLALLRHYLASHAMFNGLSALQLNLLAHQREDGLQVLRHFSGMLRGLSAISSDSLSDWAAESALIRAWAGLENTRSAGKYAMQIQAMPNTGKLPAFLLLPFAETQWLRLLKTKPPGGLEIAAKVHDTAIAIEIVADRSLPESEGMVLNHEQEQRVQLFNSRLEIFRSAGYQIEKKETDHSGLLHIQPK